MINFEDEIDQETKKKIWNLKKKDRDKGICCPSTDARENDVGWQVLPSLVVEEKHVSTSTSSPFRLVRPICQIKKKGERALATLVRRRHLAFSRHRVLVERDNVPLAALTDGRHLAPARVFHHHLVIGIALTHPTSTDNLAPPTRWWQEFK